MMTDLKATSMGRKAYNTGEKRAPILDIVFMSEITPYMVENRARFLKMWLQGWDLQNLANNGNLFEHYNRS